MKTPIISLTATALLMATALTACDGELIVDATQIDRMGRAGVNTALTDPFFQPNQAEEQERHDANALAYNSNSNPNQWSEQFAAPIQTSLAILDSLDEDCGNQLVADQAAPRYSFLAEVLADDRLYVNTISGTCNQYLAVEANAVGVLNSDCGGRTPLADTIDTTYSVLAAGALSGVGDGITQDADGTHSNSAFPFLDDPL